MTRRLALLLPVLSMLLIGSIAEPAFAQPGPLASRGRPEFGRLRLRTGFVPDPRVVRGTLGGPISANTVDRSCRGYVTRNPSHVLRSRTGFRQIRFVVSSNRDSTLMVMLPTGRILCDDDGGQGVNALVSTSAPAGDIRVWVGSYSSSGTGTPYILGVTELPSVNASSLQNGGIAVPPVQPPAPPGLAAQVPPSFGQVSLRTGFMPDPHIVAGRAGGPIAARTARSGCVGHVTPQPSHVVMSPTGFRTFRVAVNSGSLDTTLLVMLPNGQIVCDDDGGQGFNPLVQTTSPPGPIRIWVGTYSQGRSGSYNIGFSELPSVGTGQIPPPGQTAVAPPQGVVPADVVNMQVSIPVTLMGPGMSGNTVAVWHPSGGPAVRVSLNGRTIRASGVNLGAVPPSMRDPVVTVTQRRDGTLIVRCEQPPQGRGDRGQAMLYRVRWGGRPQVVDRWNGTAVQRGPRWAR